MGERMAWDHTADHALLRSFVKEVQLSQEMLRAVTEHMHEEGYTCTVKAVSQHLQKLRRKEGNNPGSGNDGAGGSAPASAATAPKTPRRRAPAAKKEPGSGTKRKAGAAASAADPVHIDDDEDEDVKPPIKKQKGFKKEEKDAAGYGIDDHIAAYTA
ncbi:hypothetical protein MMYC01_201378 [Madurella mycetomatis]|uniref:Uncharacterized protein n=1 Tax=Madurella mycetomatis TaxID=100816 RepID=A0A175WC00_9PEZI|nr:hypothetical protein MMYC01_201378 [Madurella mycetomatis]